MFTCFVVCWFFVAPQRDGPDVVQSGFGVNFLFWSGEFLGNCRRISQRILKANFDSEFFGLVFPGFQATQKIHAQNSRPELLAVLSNFHFLEPKILFTAILCLRGRPTNRWPKEKGLAPLCCILSAESNPIRPPHNKHLSNIHLCLHHLQDCSSFLTRANVFCIKGLVL